MSSALQYTLSLNDQMSSKLAKIGISSDLALTKFSKLQKQTIETNKLMSSMGSSAGSLKQKLDLLKSEREWIPATNMVAIKKYNREIGSLEKQISKLETTSTGWTTKLRESVSQIPGVGLLTNPIVAVAGATAGATKMAYDFDKGMAAINTTAQLAPKELAKLKNELLNLDPKLVKDWSEVPKAYESIISQTGDVALSTDILKTALKGSKAGFTETSTVAAALSQSLSIIGKENASATKVMDTFFAAKRVGAGEFKDFAQYMPGLIASGDALGIKFQEVAGMFAYMTGKGQSAERSTVLMENAFSAMSKVDVRKNLKDAGINIFDEKGSVRSMTSIFGDLKKKMDGMSNEQKSGFLAEMGLTDKEARSAFIIMTSDMKKLKDSMHDVKNASHETDKALKFAVSDGDRLSLMWSQAQRTGIKLGGALATVVTPALQFLGWVGGYVADSLVWLVEGLSNADPVVIGLAAGVTALTVAFKWSSIVMKAHDMWLNILIVKERIMGVVTKAKAIAMGIATAATWAWEVATIALNAAWAASPIGLITLAVVGLGAAVYGVSKMMQQQTAAERLNAEVKQRSLDKTIEQKSELAVLFDRLKQAKQGTQDYKDALLDLEAAYPGIIDKYDLQNKSIDKLNKAHLDLAANMDMIAMQEARKEIQVENYKKIFQNEQKARTMDYSIWELTKMGAGGNSPLDDNKQLKKDNAFLSKQIAANEGKTKQASKKLEEYTGGAPKKVTGEGETGSTKLNQNLYNTEESIKARIDELEGKKSKLVIGSKDYKSTSSELQLLQNKLNNGSKGSKGGSAAKSNEAIATGGSKQTTINISFKNMVETQTISGKDFKEAKQDLQDQTLDVMVRTLNMATTTAG